jgi:hypothetical protein
MTTARLTQAQIELLINQAIDVAKNNLQVQFNQKVNTLAQANAELQAAQNEIAVLQAAGKAQPQLQPAPPAIIPRAIPPVVRFSYTPGTGGAAIALIDYTTTDGAKFKR